METQDIKKKIKSLKIKIGIHKKKAEQYEDAGWVGMAKYHQDSVCLFETELTEANLILNEAKNERREERE